MYFFEQLLTVDQLILQLREPVPYFVEISARLTFSTDLIFFFLADLSHRFLCRILYSTGVNEKELVRKYYVIPAAESHA